MNAFIKIMDRLFSFFVLLVIIILGLYISFVILREINVFIDNMIAGDFFPKEDNRRMLHGIAAMIVFVKAYRILISYLQTHHVSIEYIVEISIIAPAIELLFAYETHDITTKIVFAVFGLTNLFFYLYFFGPEHDEMLHSLTGKDR